jgi:hypothetical protein
MLVAMMFGDTKKGHDRSKDPISWTELDSESADPPIHMEQQVLHRGKWAGDSFLGELSTIYRHYRVNHNMIKSGRKKGNVTQKRNELKIPRPQRTVQRKGSLTRKRPATAERAKHHDPGTK